MKNILKVNADKCVKCGMCVETCPLKIIAWEPGKCPEPVVWARKACIKCGHCVAVCPTGALDHEIMKASDCVPVKDELRLSEEELSQHFKSRRSIRVYKQEPVKKELIEKVIDVARYAPTGHNSQTVSWRVVHDKDKVGLYKDKVLDWMRDGMETRPEMAKMLQFKGIIAGCDAGLDIIMRGAPHLIIAHAPEGDRMAEASCRIALTHAELAAPAFGLGACWAGFFDLALKSWEPLKKAIELPEGHVPHCSIMLGYPKFRYKRIPLRKEPDVTWK